MKIIHIAAECAPLAQVGGLGEVVAAVTDGLAREGHEVELYLPFYSVMDRTSLEKGEGGSVQTVRIGQREFEYTLIDARQGDSPVRFRLIDCPELFDLPGVYSGDRNEPWRYALLGRVPLEITAASGRPAEIVHCHDWHAALAPALMRDGLATGAHSVLTLHNLAYQGVFDPAVASEIGAADLVSDRRLNFLESGIRAADRITAVSPTYAAEIQTEAHGVGLESLLRARSDRLVGVLNGVGEEWNPATDPRIPANYAPEDLSGKTVNRRALLERAQLDAADDTPILSTISRLVEQKGCDLFRGGFGELLERRGAVFVAVGTGEPSYEELFRDLARRHPARVAYFAEFNRDLAHLVEAGSDVFLMPSRFEPCGLNQMYSMLYGTAPVVHHTGGLADTVTPFDRDTGVGTGVVFFDYTREAFFAAVDEALDLFAQPAAWEQLIFNAMTQDFSWRRSVARYEELYTELMGEANE